MSWIESTGRQWVSEPDDRVMALGWRSRKYRRDDPRRHQFRSSEKQDIANDGLRARSVAQEGRSRQRRELRAQPFQPCCGKGSALGKDRGRQGRLRRQLCFLSWRQREGQRRTRGAGPAGSILDLRRRRPVGLYDRVERPAGPYAELGWTALPARPQDSCALFV